MFLTNLVILGSVYLSKQLFHAHTADKPASDSDSVVETASAEQQIANPEHSERQVHQYYARTSGLSIALFSAGYFLYPPLTLVNIALISYTSVPILQRAIADLRLQGKINNDGYSALIAVLTLGAGSYLAAATHNLLYHVSAYLVAQSKAETHCLTAQVYHPVPDKVWVIVDSVETQIPLEQLQAGDVVMVSTGESIPVDGLIITGSALIDQQALTGEARSLDKIQGDSVMASTFVLEGRIGVQASHSGAATRISKLNDLLEQTQDYKTQLQLKGEGWSNQMALPIMASSAVMIPFLGTGAALALLFSAPMNTVRAMLSVQTSAHMQRTLEQGVLLKDGRVLEELPRIDTLLFDKTGTLTESHPEVVDIIACADLETNALLALAAAAEQRMQHPIANAIVAQALAQQLLIPEVESSHYALGLGVSVQIAGQTILVGSQRFIQKQACIPQLPAVLEQARQAAIGHSFILLAVDGDIQGALVLKPKLRPEVPQLIKALQQRGFQQIAIVSGDQQAPTEQLANSLGIDAYSEVLPQDKALLVKQLQAQGRRVCFVGDGVNDAIAMKQANVGVCMNNASSLSHEMAQIVLLQDSLAPLDGLFDTATELDKDLSRNLYFWVGFGAVNALAVPLLAFRPLQSSLLYGAAYTLGLLQSNRA